MSDLHLLAQTSQKFGIPLNHLEYSYVEKCTDVKELEKILRLLRSGDEGRFPDLENFTEKRLEALNPKSRVLRKEVPITRKGDLSSGDWQTIEQDLKEWSNDMHTKDSAKTGKVVKADTDFYEGDENLPPIRSSNVVLEGKKKKEVKPAKNDKKKVLPRDYREWDKVDIDAELKKVDDADEKKPNTTKRSNVKGITDRIDGKGMSEEEKERKANREKDKGNEAYRSGDFEESVTYYSRSISLLATTASYNNRALAYLKLEKWDKAIKDCNTVLNLENENVKALLRRGTAYKSKNQLNKGKVDFNKVLELEPNNKKAESLLAEVKKDLEKQTQSRVEKGRRMVIEEVDESDEAEEEIEVEKPMVNGFGNHGKQNGITEVHDDVEEEKIVELIETEQGLSCPPKNIVPVSSDPTKSDQHTSSKANTQSSPQEMAKSNFTDKDTKDMCSQNLFESNASLSSQQSEDRTSAFSDVDSTQQSAATLSSERTSSSVSSLSSSSSLSETSYEQFCMSSITHPDSTPSALLSPSSASSIAADNSSLQASSDTVSEDTSSRFVRPVLVQLPLPVQVSKLKGEGNNLFRSGQYSNAIQIYSKAISLLDKDTDQNVNTSLILSNRAACHLKTGNCSGAVEDCRRSLELIPHSLKSLLRRGAAYEALEKYGHAYVDYKHALSIDNCVDQASQGASRCQKILQDIHGQRSWREKIPALVLVQPWEIPFITDQASQSPQLSQSSQPSQSSLPSQPSEPSPPSHPSEPSPPSHPSEPSPSSQSYQPPQSSQASSTDSTASVQPRKIESSSKNKATDAIPSPQKKVEPEKTKNTPQESKEAKFEKLKASGNTHVQKGEYADAEACYTSCIALCPEQVACYTNRALCYIKLNKTTEAESDCNKALNLQPDNPKALYRRALARKMLQRYKLSMQDLIELLKLEPKNKAAKCEMEIVKQYYKEELEQLKQKKTEADGKVRKRMKIEEVDDEEEEEKTGRSKAQVKSQSKSRSGKSNQLPSVAKSKGSNQTVTEKKMTEKDPAPSGQGMPSAPLSAPRLMKTTPYEFCQAWNSLKPSQGIQPYAEILRQISPLDLPSVISNKLDGQMLQIIVRCVYEEMVLKGEMDKGYQILHHLCKVPRFSTVSMFLSGKEKKDVSTVLNILGKTASSTYSKADVQHLKKEYSVK